MGFFDGCGIMEAKIKTKQNLMDQPSETKNQPQPQVQTPPPARPMAPIPPVQGPPPGQPAPTVAAPPQKKSNAWIWILGGCLGIVILGIIAMVALGWWGARKAKKELEKYTPNLQEMNENADKWNKEAEEWEKKSEEFRNSMPNPEDLQDPQNLPSGMQNPQ